MAEMNGDFTQFLKEYLNDAKDGFQEAFNTLFALEKDPDRTERLDDVFRPVHTLKSSSAMINFAEIAEAAHLTEDLLDSMRQGYLPVTNEAVDFLFEAIERLEEMVRARARKEIMSEGFQGIAARMKEMIAGAGADKTADEGEAMPEAQTLKKRISIEKIETVKVHMKLLDTLFNMVGELIITKNRIENIVGDTERKDLKAALSDMRRIIDVLQENVSTARMVPVDEIFQRFPRMVRDLSKEYNKEIEFIVEGNEIEMDKALIDAISEPIIHLLRNAVDHGIGPSAERQKAGKQAKGVIRLSAKRTENYILIDVEDDGRGIDIEKMKKVAIDKGFIKPDEAAVMKERDVLNLLFRPGFSSAEIVTDISGRGVGLDVVLTSAKKMGGAVEIATQKAKGTRFSLKLPLTTSIIQTLMISVSDRVYAIPSDIVLETMDLVSGEIMDIGRDKVLNLRGKVIPFMRLDDLLNLRTNGGNGTRSAIIIQMNDKFAAIGVDEVLNQTENIIKPFDIIAREFRGFSGGIIMGDGRVALLLDIPALINLEALKEEIL